MTETDLKLIRNKYDRLCVDSDMDPVSFIGFASKCIPALIAEVRRSRATNLQLVEVLEYIRPRVYGIESYPKFIEARDKINAAIEAAKG